MKTLKPINVALALALAAQPMAATAASERKAIEACTEAAIAGSDKVNQASLSISIDEGLESSDRNLQKGGVFYLDIRNPENGEVVARADCHFGKQAQVLSLVTVPVTAEDANRRAESRF